MKNKIAIVDDDTIFQFTTKIKIQKLELAREIVIFNDGEEILEYLLENKASSNIDVILLDINMPIMDGWDFLDAFEKDLMDKMADLKIYMLSSSINPVDVNKANDNQLVQDYIIKPIKDEDLYKILS